MDIKIYGTILIAIVLSSCVSVTRYYELRQYKLGSAISELTSVIDIEDLENVTVGGKEFTYCKSNIISSVIKKSSGRSELNRGGYNHDGVYNPNKGSGMGMGREKTEVAYAGMYFIYQSNKLYAYGHLYELKQHSDPLVVEVAKKIDEEEGEL